MQILSNLLFLLCLIHINPVAPFSGDEEPVTFGSGSGQNSVTGMNNAGDTNSLWQITHCMGCKEKPTGTPVKCGNKIRLMHTRTSKNLHSHNHQAPISGRLEVSAFGTDGKGDKGDNWKLTCMNKEAKYWIRQDDISLKHIETSHWLYTNAQVSFNRRNCGGNCPIMGQLEVSTGEKRKKGSLWKADQGVLFKVRDDFNLESGKFEKSEL